MQYTPKLRKEKLKTGIFAILDMFFFYDLQSRKK